MMQVFAAADPTSAEVARSGNMNAQRIGLSTVPIFGALLLVAFLLFSGFFPPMSPDMTALEVSDFYSRHQTMMRLSMIAFNLCGIMLIPFFMVIVVQMKRMATATPVFAYSYLTAVANGATLFAIADLLWLIGLFRGDRNPELILLLNDMAWIVFAAPVGAIVVMNICLALAIYGDKRPEPIFPRWVAGFGIVIAAAMVPSAFAAIVHTGPLAWNGLVSFWLRIIAFTSYVGVMYFVVRAAVERQEREEQDGEPAAAETAER